MINVAIVVGSTRPGRKAPVIAEWVKEIADKRGDAVYELVDIASFNLPLLDEPAPPAMKKYEKEHTKAWSAKIESFDAFVFVTPEYNHSTSAALKNALDFLFQEWNDKACGFVGYGFASGTRAVEQLRQVVGELKMADVRAQVAISLHTDFEAHKTFKPAPHLEKSVSGMLDQVVSWGTALRTVRVK